MYYKNVIFDFDGTLFNTYEGITVTLNQALSALNFPLIPDEKLRYFIGPSLEDGFKRHTELDSQQAERVIALFRALYAGGNYALCEPYEGIEALLKKLKKQGVKLSIASNKPEQFIEKILNKFQLADIFDLIIGVTVGKDKLFSDKADKVKRAVLDTPAVMVGDTQYDLEAAKAVGIDAVCALYGFGEETELRQHAAVCYASDVNQLKDFLMK